MPPQSLHYRRAAVRDLAWLVLDGALHLPPGSGALATVGLLEAEKAEFKRLLARWDQDPQDGWLGAVDPRLRLGRYTERLIGAWLSNSAQIRLMAMNWPLRANRITLGEADFLVQRSGTGSELWELACKFYLGVPGRGWLGPGLNDSLAAKLSRMRSHQLQLIHHPGFQAVWGANWTARAWMAGWLLEPVQSLSCQPPPGAATRIAGVWAEVGEASTRIAQAHAGNLGISQWWLLPKRRWLRPVFADEPAAQRFASLGEAGAFLVELAGQARPLMLAGIRWLRPGIGPTMGQGPGLQPEVPAPQTVASGMEPGAATGLIAAEAMRVMLVPPGWSRQAGEMPVHPDSGGAARPVLRA